MQCLNNIDESIQRAALQTAVHCLTDQPRMQQLFLEQSALWALAACLGDYNVSIQLSALEALIVLVSARLGPQHSVFYVSGAERTLILSAEQSCGAYLTADAEQLLLMAAADSAGVGAGSAASTSALVRNDVRRCGVLEHVLKRVRAFAAGQEIVPLPGL